jgi:hypothetical protein
LGRFYFLSKKKVETEDKFNNPWTDLLLLLFQERSFFSLRKDSKGNFSMVKEVSSKKVIDCFFNKAWERQVLKDIPKG